MKKLIVILAALALSGCSWFGSDESETDPTQESYQSDSYTSAAPAPRVPLPTEGTAVDRIVAVVNGELITMRQLDGRVSGLMNTRQAAGVSRDEMRARVLEALVDQELVNQAAKAKGVYVTASDVNAALESIKNDNNLTDDQFRASLANSGTSLEAFQEDLRVELLRNKVLGSQVMSKVVVTEKEVLSFLNGKGPDMSGMPAPPGGRAPGTDTRPLRVIFLPLDPNNRAQILAEARRIKAEIDGGLSFAEAAARYSQGPGRDNGGDTGEGMTVDKLPPPIQAALTTLSPGQASEPLEAGNAVVLLTVAEGGGVSPAPSSVASGDGEASADSFSPEQKESARRQLEAYKMQQRYVEWVGELKRNAIVKVNL
ncbi:MAG: SurA N-terminal domain-containing protein [Candidatus Adiutrix sp.]|jgi:peptidyl-prolyl cis-trans isomerase SurA|nr:SurA N-terminal domain-containing protein [Candidatus Adiutrix sp.]